MSKINNCTKPCSTQNQISECKKEIPSLESLSDIIKSYFDDSEKYINSKLPKIENVFNNSYPRGTKIDNHASILKKNPNFDEEKLGQFLVHLLEKINPTETSFQIRFWTIVKNVRLIKSLLSKDNNNESVQCFPIGSSCTNTFINNSNVDIFVSLADLKPLCELLKQYKHIRKPTIPNNNSELLIFYDEETKLNVFVHGESHMTSFIEQIKINEHIRDNIYYRHLYVIFKALFNYSQMSDSSSYLCSSIDNNSSLFIERAVFTAINCYNSRHAEKTEADDETKVDYKYFNQANEEFNTSCFLHQFIEVVKIFISMGEKEIYRIKSGRFHSKNAFNEKNHRVILPNDEDSFIFVHPYNDDQINYMDCARYRLFKQQFLLKRLIPAIYDQENESEESLDDIEKDILSSLDINKPFVDNLQHKDKSKDRKNNNAQEYESDESDDESVNEIFVENDDENETSEQSYSYCTETENNSDDDLDSSKVNEPVTFKQTKYLFPCGNPKKTLYVKSPDYLYAIINFKCCSTITDEEVAFIPSRSNLDSILEFFYKIDDDFAFLFDKSNSRLLIRFNGRNQNSCEIHKELSFLKIRTPKEMIRLNVKIYNETQFSKEIIHESYIDDSSVFVSYSMAKKKGNSSSGYFFVTYNDDNSDKFLKPFAINSAKHNDTKFVKVWGWNRPSIEQFTNLFKDMGIISIKEAKAKYQINLSKAFA